MADPTPSDLRARLLGMIADWEAEIKADRLVPEVDRDPHFVNIREHDIARMKAALTPQQAGGEDWPKVMGEYFAIMTRCEASIRESNKATLSRADMEAIERYNLADEHLSMMQADRIAELEAALREAGRDAERYRWLRDKAPDTWDVSRWLDKDTQEIHLQDDLDAAIDAALNGGQDDNA